MSLEKVNQQEAWNRLRTLVREVVARPDTELSQDTLFNEDLRLQSVQVVEIQVALEDIYDIQLDPIAVVSSRTLGDLLDYLLQELETSKQGGAGCQ